MANIAQVTDKLNTGQGTLGALINDRRGLRRARGSRGRRQRQQVRALAATAVPEEGDQGAGSRTPRPPGTTTRTRNPQANTAPWRSGRAPRIYSAARLAKSLTQLVDGRAIAMSAHVRDLEKKIRSRRATIGVAGLGYVGLPLSVEFASAGFTVTGIDPDKTKVAGLRAGKSHIEDVPSSGRRAAGAAQEDAGAETPIAAAASSTRS